MRHSEPRGGLLLLCRLEPRARRPEPPSERRCESERGGVTRLVRWPRHQRRTMTHAPALADRREAHVEEIQAHAFAPAPPCNDLLAPRPIMLVELRRQLIGLAVGYAGLAGLTKDQVDDLSGFVAAIIRDSAHNRLGREADARPRLARG